MFQAAAGTNHEREEPPAAGGRLAGEKSDQARCYPMYTYYRVRGGVIMADTHPSSGVAGAVMDYQQALEYVLSFADFERSGQFSHRPDVAPMLSLLRRLGNPHLGPTTVHIAGSKGKGSVAAIIESVLRAGGLRTGLFTSPHLQSFCERIRIDGEPVSESEFAGLVEQLQPAVEAEKAASPERQLVTFDLLTAMAFLAFHKEDIEVQIIEAGLGGRLDSTNVFESKDASVITPISFDHTAVLGNTIEMIAREKAAIIRPKTLVVMAPQAYPEAAAVIRQVAKEAGCHFVDVARDYNWEIFSHDLEGQSFRMWGPGGMWDVQMPLLGSHQLENAATAMACLDDLRGSGPFFGRQAVREGFASLRWPGRLEVLSQHPLIVVDCAHNRDSARRLRESLTDYFSCQEALLILGTLNDKDIAGMAQELAPVAKQVFATKFQHPRALEPSQIADAFKEVGCAVVTFDSEGESIQEALAQAGPYSLICAVGAVSFVGAVRGHLLRVSR